MLTDAIIVGGGRGVRLGGPVSKVLLPLGANPVLMHSILAFAAVPEVDGLVLVVPAGEETRIQAWCAQRGCSQRVRAIVPGGERRFDSVARGFARVSPQAELLLVHDAARPFVSTDLIRRVLQAAESFGVAIPGIPVVDTLKTVARDGRVVATVDRTGLVAVQTPQGFHRPVLEKIISRAQEPGWEATDEAALAERLGIPVTVVAGEAKNFKLTVPWDYALAQCLERSEPFA